MALELSEDREGTIADLAYVISKFKMPADGLIANYRQRLQTSGAGISPRAFLERVVLPTVKTLGTSREKLKLTLKKRARITLITVRERQRLFR